MSEPILRTNDLHKSYDLGRRLIEVLHGVSLEIGEGEFLSLQGASGTGKSTLLHLLGGLDDPTSGEVFASGQSLSAMSSTRLAKWRSCTRAIAADSGAMRVLMPKVVPANRAAAVGNSRVRIMSPMYEARSRYDSSSHKKMPPSPPGASLSPCRLNTEMSPSEPHIRPRHLAPCACEASSMIFSPCRSAMACSSVILDGNPQRCTTTMALVLSVIFASTSTGSRPRRSGSLSQNTGTAPSHSIGITDAQKVAVGTSTSSPGLRPSAKKDAINAEVPLLWDSANLRPVKAA